MAKIRITRKKRRRKDPPDRFFVGTIAALVVIFLAFGTMLCLWSEEMTQKQEELFDLCVKCLELGFFAFLYLILGKRGLTALLDMFNRGSASEGEAKPKIGTEMTLTTKDKNAVEKIVKLANDTGVDIKSGKVRWTSSRFCLAVEHGDYNGTELFGIGTDRFVWLAYKPNGTGRMRLFSGNFPGGGIVGFDDISGSNHSQHHTTFWAYPAAFLLALLLIVVFEGIAHFYPWEWLLNHPKTIPLQIGIDAMFIFGSAGIFFKKTRKWCWGVGVFGIALVLLGLSGG